MHVCRISGIACVTALVAAAGAGPIYGIKSLAPASGAPSTSPANLYWFNSDGTGFTDRGAITVGGFGQVDADGLAISSRHGLLAYHLTGNGSTLMSLNVDNAVGTHIGGALLGRQIRGAAFDLADRLWAIDSVANEILRINPLTGAILSATSIQVGSGTLNLFDSSDIAVRASGAMILASGDSFYSLDPFSGSASLIGTHAGNSLSGLSFSLDAPADRLFGFEVNGTDDIFYYNIDTSFAPNLLLQNIIPGFNSGRGDLASLVPAPGAGVLLFAGLAASGRRRRI